MNIQINLTNLDGFSWVQGILESLERLQRVRLLNLLCGVDPIIFSIHHLSDESCGLKERIVALNAAYTVLQNKFCKVFFLQILISLGFEYQPQKKLGNIRNPDFLVCTCVVFELIEAFEC